MKAYTLHRQSTGTTPNRHDEEFFSVQTVPTISTKPKQEMNIKCIKSLDDLKSIKQQDPFMYYSIPGVRDAKLRMKDDADIDTSNLGVSGMIKRDIKSCPSRIIPSNKMRRLSLSKKKNEVWDDQSGSKNNSSDVPSEEEEEEEKVTRRTSISFEVHPDLILEDFLETMGSDEDDDEVLADHFDMLQKLLSVSNKDSII
jgi:hypothetical protein